MFTTTMSKARELTDSQISAFQELKSRVVEEYGPNVADDGQIIRFLSAREYQIKQAYTMIKKDIEWRKQHSICTIIQDYKERELFTKYVPMNIIGFDKDNTSLIVFQFGNTDFKGLLQSAKLQEVLLYITYIFELSAKQLQERSIETGVHVDTWTIIADMENLPFSQLSSKIVIEYLIELAQLNDAHFPEMLKSAYVVNASATFQFLYSILKTFVASKTQKKLNFYGKDGWKEDLLKFIDPEVLPAYLGGKRTDPDGNPMCHTIVCHGGPVPETFFMKNTKNIVEEPSPYYTASIQTEKPT